jgi:hypothetical protein
MPDGFPERLKSATADEFSARLQDDWRAQRKTLSELPQPGRNVDDYKYAPSDKIKDLVGDLAQDKTFGLVRAAALKAGVTPASFEQLVGGFYEGMAAEGLLAKPLDVTAEALKFLGDPPGALDEKAALSKLAPLVEPIEAGLKKLAADSKLGPESLAALYGLLDTADGLRAAKALTEALTGQPGMKPGGDGGGAGNMSRQQLIEMAKDPRAQRDNVRYDPEFAKQVDDSYRRYA